MDNHSSDALPAAEPSAVIRRVAVVTGGNRGIGFEICRQLSQLGLHVVLTARDESSAKEAADRLQGEGRGLVMGARLDVNDDDSVTSTFAEIARSHGAVDVLVNNAGIAIDGPAVHRATAPDFTLVEQTLATNLYGAWRCSAAAIPFMLERGYGRIVNVSSTMASLALTRDSDVSGVPDLQGVVEHAHACAGGRARRDRHSGELGLPRLHEHRHEPRCHPSRAGRCRHAGVARHAPRRGPDRRIFYEREPLAF